MPTRRCAYESLSEACDPSPASHPPTRAVEIVYPTADRPAPVQHRDTIYLRHGLNVTLHDRGVRLSAGDDTSYAVPILAGDIVHLIEALARKLVVAVWQVVTEREANRRSDPDMLASKPMPWSWKLGKKHRGGLTIPPVCTRWLDAVGDR